MMKTYKSLLNGGQTIELCGCSDAISTGRSFVDQMVKTWTETDPDTKLAITYRERDSGKAKEKKSTAGALADKWRSIQTAFNECANAIAGGSSEQKAYISELAERILHLAHLIEPSLTVKPSGFERAAEGFDLSPEALMSGDERPAFRRKREAGNATGNPGGEAYRVIINTDVSWFGKPDDNAGLIGGLVLCLQQFGPVQIWIQQGWLGHSSTDGVTLFQLDFNGTFDPTQLAFWVGHPQKDAIFSYCVSRGLKREGFGTSSEPEITADLYLRGDWLKMHGINEGEFLSRPKEEQNQLMAQWVAATSMRMLGRPSNN